MDMKQIIDTQYQVNMTDDIFKAMDSKIKVTEMFCSRGTATDRRFAIEDYLVFT